MYRNFIPQPLLAPAPEPGSAPAKPFADGGEARNSAVKYPVTLGANVSNPGQICVRDIAYVVSCLKTGIVEGIDLRARIAVIRGLPNPDLANAMKKQLPWFCGSLCVGRRSNQAVKQAQFIVFDLDHIEDIEALKQRAVEQLVPVRYAFRSVRDGVKLIAALSRPVTTEKDFRLIWDYLALQIETLLGIRPDRTSDWSRACFFSHDPDLIVNPKCQPLDVDIALKQAQFIIQMAGAGKLKLYPRATPISTLPVAPTTTSNDTFEKARTIVRKLASLRMEYLDWISAGMALYAGFGEAGRELWDLFLDNPNYNDHPRLMDAKWRSFRQVREITLDTLFHLGRKYGCS